MKKTFPLDILYAEITIYEHGAENPALLWEEEHVAQGFAWDANTVSFGVPDADAAFLIDIDIADECICDAEAAWAIAVPFQTTSDSVHIGTLEHDELFELNPGSYTLLFEALPSDQYEYLLRIRFILDDQPEFKILKKGGQVQADQILRKDAQRA